MSETFYARCDTCEVDGPPIDRKAGGTALLYPDQWQAFLTEHAWCRIRLRHEGSR